MQGDCFNVGPAYYSGLGGTTISCGGVEGDVDCDGDTDYCVGSSSGGTWEDCDETNCDYECCPDGYYCEGHECKLGLCDTDWEECETYSSCDYNYEHGSVYYLGDCSGDCHYGSWFSSYGGSYRFEAGTIPYCCGNNPNEYELYYLSDGTTYSSNDGDELFESGSTNGNDKACCNSNDDCVFNGGCYSSSSAHTIGSSNDKVGYCKSRWWRDPDKASASGDDQYCSSSGLNWVLAGESGVGEYDSTTKYECCGDDSGEYLVSGKCCNSPTDIVLSGVCVEACSYSTRGVEYGTSYCQYDYQAESSALCPFRNVCLLGTNCFAGTVNMGSSATISGEKYWCGWSCNAADCANTYHGKWYDLDDSQGLCENTDLRSGGAIGTWTAVTCDKGVGVCDTHDGTGDYCCGDDDNEYYITTGSYSACCDSPTDLVDSNGNCQEGFVCGDNANCAIDGDFSDYACTSCSSAWYLNFGDSASGCFVDSCCGDDTGEIIRYCEAEGVITDDPDYRCDPVRYSCCDSATDCVYDGSTARHCAESGTLETDPRGVQAEELAYCDNGKWYDCDEDSTVCGICGKTWIAGGELVSFGEYSPGGEIDCCGDDSGEYLVTTGSYSACCNKEDDWVDSDGKCQAACQPRGGICDSAPCCDVSDGGKSMYCGDLDNLGSTLSPKRCCETNESWNPSLLRCVSTEQCYPGSTGPCDYSPDSYDWWHDNPACLDPGVKACCYFDEKYGLSPYYDFEEITVY